MEKMIAYCGIVCTECPAFLATQNDDDNERKRVAELWSKQFNSDIKPEDINCVGCLSKGTHFSYCNDCCIKKCAEEKGVINCAYCDNYPCERLNKFFKMATEAKNTLDEIRKNP